MYMIIVLAVVIVIWIIGAVMAGGWGGLITMLDLSALIMVLVIGGAIVVITGFWKDFRNAFRLTMGKRRQVGLAEWKRAKEAVELFMAALRYGGFFVALLQFIAISTVSMETAADKTGIWWINLSIATLPLLYAYAVNILLLPIKSKININIIDYMQRLEDGDGMAEEGGR